MQDEEEPTEEEQTITVPAEATPPEAEVVEVPEEEPKGELDDLFETPQPEDHDINVDDLLEIDEEDIIGGESVDDLVDVSNEDIMGTPPVPKSERVQRPVRRFRLVRRQSPPPPTSIRGVGQ